MDSSRDWFLVVGEGSESKSTRKESTSALRTGPSSRCVVEQFEFLEVAQLRPQLGHEAAWLGELKLG
jgi:hypothetical protein